MDLLFVGKLARRAER